MNGGHNEKSADPTSPAPAPAYGYDGLNRLTVEVTPEGSVNYSYDAASRRIGLGVPQHAGVRKVSVALRAAYNELVAKYPNGSPANKDAFFKVGVEGGSG
jgi:YD repeat-containing protein